MRSPPEHLTPVNSDTANVKYVNPSELPVCLAFPNHCTSNINSASKPSTMYITIKFAKGRWNQTLMLSGGAPAKAIADRAVIFTVKRPTARFKGRTAPAPFQPGDVRPVERSMLRLQDP
eukprot:CAMPEP_0194524732 /NCGR_PEP_ID=MMETSP0253-20130528/60024_1 /TAXON_ID=2966 /ORGANISM="Noctiluca scintillans" /LENGTH=118 /DNA_ID=CAMNT_0039369391 /DNA_START=1083 /DNA_END=1439 /DNA_ORIENTATION=+